MRAFADRVRSASEAGELFSLVINASASPEGGERPNAELASRRARSLADYLEASTGISVDNIKLDAAAVGWQGLRAIVSASDMRHRGEVIDIIDNVPIYIFRGSDIVDSRLKRLMDLDGGRPYWYMHRNMFPDVRLAEATIHFATPGAASGGSAADAGLQADSLSSDSALSSAVKDTSAAALLNVPADSLSAGKSFPEEGGAEQCGRVSQNSGNAPCGYAPRLKLKTNVVALAMLMANAGIEVDIAPRLSLNLPFYYSGADYFTPTVKFRMFGVQPELRYWPGPARRFFTGLHLGLAYYNFAWETEWRYQDKSGNTPGWGGGLSMGYRLPLDEDERWNVEFTAGAGVYDMNYDRFYNVPNGALESTNRKIFFCLDNVAVSFSYSFDLKKKGGRK